LVVNFPDGKKAEKTIPIEDLNYVVIDPQKITITKKIDTEMASFIWVFLIIVSLRSSINR